MSMNSLRAHHAPPAERNASWWLLLPVTFVASSVVVLVMLSAAATGSSEPPAEPLYAPAALAPQGDTTVPSAASVLRDLPTPTGENDAPTF